MNLTELIDQFEVVTTTTEGLNELRSLILGLAVRGKLVPQDHNDEPASKLLKKIEKVKKRLYEDGYIQKPKKTKKVKDSEELFAIPDNWQWVRLNNLTTYIQRGKSPKYQEGSGVFVINQKCVRWDGIELKHAKEIKPKSLLNHEGKRFIQAGDILWNSTGTGTIGRLAIASHREVGLTVDSHVTLVRTDSVLPKFIWCWLAGKEVYDEIENNASGSTNQIELTKSYAVNLPTPIPPLKEQHGIVKKIESLFAEVDALEVKLEQRAKQDEKLQAAVNTEVQNAPDAESSQTVWQFITNNFETLYHTPEAIDNLKKNILNEAVRGRLVAQDPNDEPAVKPLTKIKSEEKLPFEIPKNWKWCYYCDVAELRHGHQFRKYDFVEDGIPVVKIGQCKPDGSLDLTNCNYIEHSRKEEFEGYLVEKGDLLMALTGGTLGKVTRVDKDYGIIVQNYRVGNFIPQSDSLSLDYLNVILESELFQGLVRKKINQNAQPNIGKSSIEQILMPIPPLKEQHRIVWRIEELFAICDRFKVRLKERAAVNEKLVKGLVGEVLEGS